MPASRDAWLDRVRALDAAGVDVLLMPDHFGLWPVFPPLVAAAGVSERLRFGVQVLNNEFWEPALLAREAAAADVLTGGRLELGLGAGHAQIEFAAVGIPYRPVGERVSRLGEAIRLVRRLLAGEVVTSDGAYPLRDCTLGLRSVQTPIPFMVGGNGDRILRLAAREAEIVTFTGFRSGTGPHATDLSHFSWTGLADRVAHVVQQANPDRTSPERSILLQRVVLTAEPARLAEEISRDPSAARALLDNPFMLLGEAAFLTGQLRRLRDELGVTYFTTFERDAPALAAAARGLRERSRPGT